MAWPREYFGAGLDSEVEQSVRAAIKVYEGLGAKIEEVSLPHSPYAIATYYLVATAEASSNLARYDGVHYGHRSSKPGDLIDMVLPVARRGFRRRGEAAYHAGDVCSFQRLQGCPIIVKALQVRRLIRNDFDQAFSRCDVVLGPTSPTAAFKSANAARTPLQMYLSDIYTISCNLAGIAGISLPGGFTQSGLPIGLQLPGGAV